MEMECALAWEGIPRWGVCNAGSVLLKEWAPDNKLCGSPDKLVLVDATSHLWCV